MAGLVEVDGSGNGPLGYPMAERPREGRVRCQRNETEHDTKAGSPLAGKGATLVEQPCRT